MFLFEINLEVNVQEIPVETLAFLGDSILQLYFKIKLLEKYPRSKARFLHLESKKFLSSVSHAQIMDEIFKDLTDQEKSIYKRGYNSKSATKKGNDENYRKSTGLETLIGYLYITRNYDRLEYVLKKIVEIQK